MGRPNNPSEAMVGGYLDAIFFNKQLREIVGSEAFHKPFDGMVLILPFITCPILLLVHP